MSVRVERAIYGGSFRCENDASLDFVLPGELVVTDTTGGGASVLLEPSVHRTVAACVHFGICGGCQYQHASYPEQLQIKKTILCQLLRESGMDGLPEPRIHAGEPWGYRNRIRLRLERVGDALRTGYSGRRTNEFLPVRMCPIATPVLWRAAETLLQLAEEDSLSFRWLSSASEVELFTTGDEGQLQLTLFLRDGDVPQGGNVSFTSFCECLQARLPELVGAGAIKDPELGRRERRSWPGTTWGAAGLAYPVGGRTYWVSRGAFFQVNRFLLNTLVELVTDGRAGALAWDIFAGVGLFSRALAAKFERVVAVEGSSAGAADLAQAAKGTRGSGGAGPVECFTAVHAPALEFLHASVHQRDRPELVILDPPRAGLGVEGCKLLAKIGPAEIVYVSCDPTALVRDLAILHTAGYRAEAVHLVDLFPQTFHIEAVVSLRRT